MVVNGMTHTLENPSLHSIIIELNDSGKRYGFDDDCLINKLLGFGFRMYAYQPYNRELIPITKKNEKSNNTLFLRDENFINQRLATAPKFKIGSCEL